MTVNSPKLLLIEDDEDLAELIVECLTEEHFAVTHVVTGFDAINETHQQCYDLIICDLMLPDQHGFDLIKELEYSHTCPIIFLTALSDDQTHIKGLENGAADFIAKPVDPNVLIARIKANLRQFNHRPDLLTIGDFTFNARNKSLSQHGKTIAITNKEFDILWLFIKKPDTPLSREYLFERIVGRKYDGLDRAADLKISRLRKKLQQLGCSELSIDTIRNKGYFLSITESKRDD